MLKGVERMQNKRKSIGGNETKKKDESIWVLTNFEIISSRKELEQYELSKKKTRDKKVSQAKESQVRLTKVLNHL